MTTFEQLSPQDRADVETFVLAQWETAVTVNSPTYVAQNAKADPEGWRERLRELIAADPKRAQAIVTLMRRGFTLIELSIVLVVIGLIVGGIVGGRALVRASELQSVITDVKRYTEAVHQFEQKYGSLPGDMANATSYWGG